MKKLRALVLTHESLVPPDSLEGHSQQAIDEWQTEYDAEGHAARESYLARGRLQRVRADLTGKEPGITDEVVGIYRHEWAYDSTRAITELGYAITPLEDGLTRTVEWLRREKGSMRETR